IGMETTVEVNGKINNVLVLAKNNLGYQSLLKISSMIQTAEEKQVQLSNFSELIRDCFLILPIETTQLKDLFNENDQEALQAFLQVWPEQPLIGINRFELDLIRTANQLDVDLVALGDVRYVEKTDQQAYRYLRAIDQKVKL